LRGTGEDGNISKFIGLLVPDNGLKDDQKRGKGKQGVRDMEELEGQKKNSPQNLRGKGGERKGALQKKIALFQGTICGRKERAREIGRALVSSSYGG